MMAAVIFGYEPQHPDELVLVEGDMVEITKQVRPSGCCVCIKITTISFPCTAVSNYSAERNKNYILNRSGLSLSVGIVNTSIPVVLFSHDRFT